MTLSQIRKKLDSIDIKLVKLIAERQSFMVEVGKYKRENKIPYHQPEREKQILKLKKRLANELGINQNLIEKIFILFFEDAKRIQRLKK